MERCPHGCGNEWHESELTNTVAGFFRNHRFDKDYDPEADDSGVACIGSLTHGPAKPVPGYYYPPSSQEWVGLAPYDGEFKPFQPLYGSSPAWKALGTISDGVTVYTGGKSPGWLDGMISATAKWVEEISFQWVFQPWQSYLLNDWFAEWKAPCEQKPVDENLPKVDVKFGPENWINTEPRQLGYATQYIPLPKLAEWRAIPLPTFKSKDLSVLADEINAKSNPTYGSFK